MLTLNDGRTELWQWDTGRKLTVDADCSQVHFSNKFFGRSVDVDVVNGTATIPDVLLQVDKELLAWAFVGTAKNGYTKISKVFKVNKRNKPSDYVFTPPEQTSLEEILKKIDYLESIQDPDAIKNAVDDYLANNPIKVNETDPTVSDWAKQETKPKYTATEVGAVATVNGIAPDENGNVEIEVSGGNSDQSGGLTTAQIEALHGMFKVCAYDDSKDVSGAYAAFKTAFGITDSGEEEPDEPVVPDEPEEPDTPVVTLTSITATYSGGDVTVGTAVVDLTGIVVTAHYSDGTSEAVTGYTLSGTIAEGSNAVTVSYGGKTTTFTVTGVAESGSEAEPTELTIVNRNVATAFYGDEGVTALDASCGSGCTQYMTEKVAKVDTDVVISVLYGVNNTLLEQHAGCIEDLASTNAYYVEKIGYAQTSEYTYTYTVKAGYRLGIFNGNAGVPNSVTVTTTTPDDWEEAVSDNRCDGKYVVGDLSFSNGTVNTAVTGSKTTDYIACADISEIYTLIFVSNVKKMHHYGCAFYNADKQFVFGVKDVAPTTDITPVPVPDGAAYIRCTYGATYGANYPIYIGESPDPDTATFVMLSTLIE